MERNLLVRLQKATAVFGCAALTVFTAPAQMAPSAPAPQGGYSAPAQMMAPQQLDNLVAPIALYPDPLLAQVLAASTYPVELVEAQQWLTANPNLNGQPLMDAARQQNWDPSIQALVAMPDVLSLLTQDIRWTTDLGNAFLAQQPDVMSAVQRMRERARANGQLQSGPQEIVTTENQGGQQAIDITPANPQQIYVPAYDPYYVYGYGDYPALYYPDGYWFEPGIDVGLYFGGWGGWGFGGWGWGCNWFGRGLFVNNFFFNRYGFHREYEGGRSERTAWAHDPSHRLGASYPTSALNGRFGAASQASRMAAGRSGNWHSFGQGGVARANADPRNSFTPSQGTARSYYGAPGTRTAPGGGQSFRAPAGSYGARSAVSSQRFSAPIAQPRNAVPQQRFSAPIAQPRNAVPQQRFSAPSAQPRNAVPQQRFSAPIAQPRNAVPQQRFSAPAQRSFPTAAPRAAAPSFGGGSPRSFVGGGGGGGARPSGGGGPHGGGRR